ncbi:ribonuclease III [Candidatus Peregrinibacteria bacterium]|nr:ribonuclease III [Candidatus Peregrinibacteria bacterium]
MMENYKELEEKIGITFKNKEILERSFIHKSYINEHKGKGVKDNERLEFLGDAVLELVATRHLYFNYPGQQEGTMTAFRSALVKGKHLAEVARELDVGNYLFLSKGEDNSGGRSKNYILANTLEALIGAIYVDQGYKHAEGFIERFILTKLDKIIEKGLHIDSKSLFQELSQEKEDITPEYKIESESGPDHNKKFIMGAYIGSKLIAKGTGSSKQKAEDNAAKKALIKKGWI